MMCSKAVGADTIASSWVAPSAMVTFTVVECDTGLECKTLWAELAWEPFAIRWDGCFRNDELRCCCDAVTALEVSVARWKLHGFPRNWHSAHGK